jgi:hypothetical protein
MLAHEVIKAALSKTSRSDFHHFLIPSLDVNRIAKSEHDAIGAAMVVILSVVLVLLVRVVLAN